jgi:hypothetical protein
MKTNELTGRALDWAVVMIESGRMGMDESLARSLLSDDDGNYSPSTDWAQGGPIIEREEISLTPPLAGDSDWFAACGFFVSGPTPLIAAMRSYVASKLGDEIEVPEELK